VNYSLRADLMLCTRRLVRLQVAIDELRLMFKDAVRSHFGDSAAGDVPHIIRLQFIRDEVLTE
jgi:hypothetical protein